jgi:hypothetical protein
MAEGLAKGGDVQDEHIQAYATWGSGKWGGLLTGILLLPN